MSPPDLPAAPRPVVAAGVLVALQGVLGVVVGVWLGVSALREPGPIGVETTVATVVWFVGSGAALIAIGANLVRGRHGARSPAIVVQFLLLGVCWYAAGPSSQPVYGVLGAVFCLAVLAALFSPPAVRWASGRELPDADGPGGSGGSGSSGDSGVSRGASERRRAD